MDLRSCLPAGWLGDESFPVAPVCSCGLTGAPFEFHAPGCDRAARPYLDDESLMLVDDAVGSLAVLRGSQDSDAGAVLSCLASLIAEAQSRLPDVVGRSPGPGLHLAGDRFPAGQHGINGPAPL